MAFRSSNSASSSVGVTSIQVTQPSGVATGDRVVCALSDDSSSITITLPTGATAIPSSPQTCTFDATRTAVGVREETGTPPATYDFSLSSSNQCGAVAAAFSGVSGVHQSSGVSSGSGGSASPLDVDATGVTTTVECDLCWIGAPDFSSTNAKSMAPPTNYTEREDVYNGSYVEISVATRDAVGAGSTGTVTGVATCASANGGYVAFLIALATSAADLFPYDHDGCAPWSSIWRPARV